MRVTVLGGSQYWEGTVLGGHSIGRVTVLGGPQYWEGHGIQRGTVL